MTVTSTSLTRAAGISAAVAGLLFIAVQINHPVMDVSSVTTTEWVVRQTAKTVMAAAALVGITGMYLRQVRQAGILGLVGYLLFSAGYLVMLGIEFAGAYVLPSLAHTAPGYVNDVLAAGIGDTVRGDIGAMQTAFALMAVGYLAGGVLFGLALFRARVLARWASGLLVLGTLATLALHVLPHSFERPLAVPTGVALIGLGISLWRDQRKTAAVTTSDLAYEFRVEGHLDDHWSAWLGDLTITRHHDGTSTLTGPVADQAQLHGMLARLRDIGATLLSLNALEVPSAVGSNG